MPVLRSEYLIEQFEAVLQRMAHEIPKFQRVEAEDVSMEFQYDVEGKLEKIHVYFRQKTGGGYWDWESWSLTITPKNYESGHVAKIEFSGDEQKVKAWIDAIMAGIEPTPRFRLKDMGSFPRKLDFYIKRHERKSVR